MFYFLNYDKLALRAYHSYRGARQIFMQALDFSHYLRKLNGRRCGDFVFLPL